MTVTWKTVWMNGRYFDDEISHFHCQRWREFLNGLASGVFSSSDASSDCLMLNICERPIDLDSVLLKLKVTFPWKWLFTKSSTRCAGHCSVWGTDWCCSDVDLDASMLDISLACFTVNVAITIYSVYVLMSRYVYDLVCRYVLVIKLLHQSLPGTEGTYVHVIISKIIHTSPSRLTL